MIYDIKQSGLRIRQLRLKSGFTQEKIAEALGVDSSFYSRIESGKKGCSVDLLIQFSELYHVSLDYLILRYILVTRLLEQAAEAGLLSAEELWAAKRLALERYRPATVWE